MPQLILHRTGITQQLFGTTDIEIDGKMIGSINRNDCRKINLDPGEYTIKLKHLWFESEPTSIVVYERGDTNIELTGGELQNKYFYLIGIPISLIIGLMNTYFMSGFLLGLITTISYQLVFLRKSYIKVTPA